MVFLNRINTSTNINESSSNNLNSEQWGGAISDSESRSKFTKGNSCSTSNMKVISMEEYRRLYDCSIELYKASKMIDKFNAIIQDKNIMIEKLKENSKTKHARLSSVSTQILKME